MMLIKKDIATIDFGILVHGVNCQGVMGSGVAKVVKETWPEVYQQYKSDHAMGVDRLGTIRIVNVKKDLYVVNAYTQKFYGDDGALYADLSAILSCLLEVKEFAHFVCMPIFMPKIGCGLGGLEWAAVRKIVEAVDGLTDTVTGTITVCYV